MTSAVELSVVNPLHRHSRSWRASTDELATASPTAVASSEIPPPSKTLEERGWNNQKPRRNRRRSAIISQGSAIVDSSPSATEKITWFALYGCEGVLVVFALAASLAIVCLLIATHCTDSLLAAVTEYGGGGPRFNLLPYIGISPGLSAALGIVFSPVSYTHLTLPTILLV